MTYHETVIKALERCAIGTNNCFGCPMQDECKGVSNAAMLAAIDLLKEYKRELNSLGKSLNEANELLKKCRNKLRKSIDN